MSLSKNEVLALSYLQIKNYITNIDIRTLKQCLIEKPIIFSQLKDHKLYKDEKFIIKISKTNPLIIAYISTELKHNLNFMLKLSKIPNTVEYCYYYASDEIKFNIQFKTNLINNDVEKTIQINNFYNNSGLIKHGISKSANVFRTLPISITDNIDCIKELLNINPFIIEFLSRDLKTNREIISIVLYKDGLTLQFLPQIYLNYIIIAIKSNANIIDYLRTFSDYDKIYNKIREIVFINYNVRLFLNNKPTINCDNLHLRKRRRQKDNHKQNILRKLSVCDYFFELKFNRMIIDYLIDNVRYLSQHHFIAYKNVLSIIDNYN